MNWFLRSPSRRILGYVLLLIFLAGASVGVGYFVQNSSLSAAFDSYFYRLIHGGPHYAWLDMLIKPVNFNFLSNGTMPSYLYFYGGFFLLYMLAFRRKQFGWALLAVFLGTVFSMLIASLDWHTVFRHRPFEILPNTVDDFGKRAWRSWSSYPSGHVRETALYSVMIAYFIPRLWVLVLVFTLFIGYSRIYIGAHFPTDVISGILIGYFTGVLTVKIIEELKKVTVWKGPQLTNNDENN